MELNNEKEWKKKRNFIIDLLSTIFPLLLQVYWNGTENMVGLWIVDACFKDVTCLISAEKLKEILVLSIRKLNYAFKECFWNCNLTVLAQLKFGRYTWIIDFLGKKLLELMFAVFTGWASILLLLLFLGTTLSLSLYGCIKRTFVSVRVGGTQAWLHSSSID